MKHRKGSQGMMRASLIFSMLLFKCNTVSAVDKREVLDNLKSPITTNSKFVVLGGGALTLSLVALKKQIGDPLQKDAIERKPLGKWSKTGDILGQLVPNAVYVGGMLIYGRAAYNDKAYQDASLMFQASLYSGLTTTILKYTVREPRPNNTDHKNSFPSGHATTIFAFASYVGCRHTLPWGVAAYTTAAFVAYSRINDNVHYLHDVVGGATIGTAFGYGVCLAERRRLDNAVNTIAYLIPVDGGLGAGLSHSF